MIESILTTYIKYFTFVLVVTIVSTIFFIIPDFLDNPISDVREMLTMASYVLAIGLMQFLILNLLCINKFVYTIFMPIYVLLGAIISYYRFAYSATITPMIVEVTLHTNAGEIFSVISWSMVLWLLFNILWLSVSIIYRWKCTDVNNKHYLLLLIILALPLYYCCSSRLKQSINQRYPMNLVMSLFDYYKLEKERNIVREMPNFSGVIEVDTIDIVIVIGESMRADHLSINGYNRETCPLIGKQKNVISLPHIYSEYTHTAASLPHIITNADSINPNNAFSTHSLIRCLSDSGFYTSWISNQDYGHTYSAFIHEADTVIFTNAEKTVFVFDPWYDKDLLPEIDKIMMKNRNSAKNLYVFHTIGSHWYYNSHVPEEFLIFKPITSNRTAKKNTLEQIRNSYDNTVLCLDFFLNQLIKKMEYRTSIIFYISDHGEALGEDGNYLHANGAEAVHYPAALVWYSDKYENKFPKKVEALNNNNNKYYRTDYLFPSVLSSVGLKAEGIDIFSESLTPHKSNIEN